MISTGAASLNLSANGMTDTSDSRLHAIPQGDFDMLEMGMGRNSPQAGQRPCHSMLWAGEAFEGRQSGVGGPGKALDQGGGEELAGFLQRVANLLPAGLWKQDCSQRGMKNGSLPAPATSPSASAFRSSARDFLSCDKYNFTPSLFPSLCLTQKGEPTPPYPPPHRNIGN